MAACAKFTIIFDSLVRDNFSLFCVAFVYWNIVENVLEIFDFSLGCISICWQLKSNWMLCVCCHFHLMVTSFTISCINTQKNQTCNGMNSLSTFTWEQKQISSNDSECLCKFKVRNSHSSNKLINRIDWMSSNLFRVIVVWSINTNKMNHLIEIDVLRFDNLDQLSTIWITLLN